jgi:hypothetical protein
MDRMFSRELTERAIVACNEDREHLQRAQLLTGRVILRALDAPDGNDVQISYDFERGRCTAHRFDEAPAPAAFRSTRFTVLRDGLVRITALYETWARLDRGELEPEDALHSPDYKLDGNLALLVPLTQAVNSWTAKIRALPKSY